MVDQEWMGVLEDLEYQARTDLWEMKERWETLGQKEKLEKQLAKWLDHRVQREKRAL
jgi:hypothetical protein